MIVGGFDAMKEGLKDVSIAFIKLEGFIHRLSKSFFTFFVLIICYYI